MPDWLAPDFAARTTAASRPGAFEAFRGRDLDFRSIAGHPFWQTLFLWGDPTFTHLPLRLRHPLADLRLIDFVSRLPPEPWLVRKRILREAVRDLLPEPVLSRRKTPLVRTRRAGISREAVGGLAELARTLPEIERFFDPNALLEAILAPEAAIEHPQDPRLVRALGLVHWRAHWRRPDASGIDGVGRPVGGESRHGRGARWQIQKRRQRRLGLIRLTAFPTVLRASSASAPLPSSPGSNPTAGTSNDSSYGPSTTIS